MAKLTHEDYVANRHKPSNYIPPQELLSEITDEIVEGIFTHAEWAEFKKRLDEFYDSHDEQYVADYNASREADYDEKHHLYFCKECRAEQLRGYVYLLAGNEGVYKIGSTKRLVERIYELTIGMPFTVRLVHSAYVADSLNLEHRLHKKYAKQRAGGEWFNLTPQDVSDICSLQDEFTRPDQAC